jgi:chromosome segregation ATPase
MINASLITTAAQCQEQLADTNTESARLDVRKRGLERAIVSNESDTQELPTEIASLESQLTILNNALGFVPEGSAKNDLLDQISDLEIQLIQSKADLRNIGPAAKALRMLNLNSVTKSITVNQNYRTIIESRLAELGTQKKRGVRVVTHLSFLSKEAA